MFDWDNIRFFLHVARSGSIRGAASILNVNHATVLRRIAIMEDQLGTRLFERLPSGYQITSAGEDILSMAEDMEADALALERKVFGRDTALTGSLRVTLPSLFATDLLMEDVAGFRRKYPGIDLELETSNEPFNLTKRQADVAIRAVYKSPPEHLFGRKVVGLYRSVYLAPSLWNQVSDLSDLGAIPWIRKEEDGTVPQWALGCFRNTSREDLVELDQRHLDLKDANKLNELIPKVHKDLVVNDPLVQLQAAREGMGAVVHFCFLGDRDPGLVRAPKAVPHHYADIWILTHSDLRRVPRIKVFMRHMAEALEAKNDLLSGKV